MFSPLKKNSQLTGCHCNISFPLAVSIGMIVQLTVNKLWSSVNIERIESCRDNALEQSIGFVILSMRHPMQQRQLFGTLPKIKVTSKRRRRRLREER